MKRLVALLAGAMLLVGMATTANALSVKYSTDGITYSSVFTDNGAGDNDGTAGVLNISPTVGGFSTLSITANAAHESNLSGLYTTSIEAASSTAAKIYIMVTDLPYNLSMPLGHGANAVTGLTFNIGGKTADLEAFYGIGAFDMTNVIADMDVSSLGVTSVTSSLPGITNPFSLTELLIITHDKKDHSLVTGSLELTPVPEPGTMMLLGAGFLGLAIYGKRRKNA
jgi:hypothetical protein